MSDFSGIPRAFDVREAKRAREEAARLAEQRSSARNTSSTTIGSGGRLDVDGGDLTILNGGNAAVKDGGAFRVEGGGSMEIVDDGQVNVRGNGRGWSADTLIQVVASFANRMAYNAWIGYSYLVPGLYFTAEGESQGPYDPRIVSERGKDVSAISAVEKLPYGPQVGPTIMSKGSFGASPWATGMGASAWDDAINPGGSDGVAGVRGSGSYSATPYDIHMLLTNHTPGPDGIPDGPAVWIHGTLEDGVLELYGREGVNITGTFTVNGLPVGGAVSSVAGKTGDVTLVKADVGLSNVDNTSDASKPVATALVNGLMPSTDKSKIDGSTPSATAFRMVQRDSLGRAKFTDPAVAADAATKGYVDAADTALVPLAYAALSPAGWTATGVLTKSRNSLGDAVNMDFNLTRTGGTLALTTAWTNIGVVIPPELLPPSGAAQHRYGFAFLAGFNVQIKMFVNAANGQVSLSALTGTQNIPSTNQVFIVTSWPYI